MSKRGAKRPIFTAEAAKLVIFIPGMVLTSAAQLGGAYRDRTDDLKLAKLALSQLS